MLCSLVGACVWWGRGEAESKVGWDAEGGEFIHSKEPNKLLLDSPQFQHFLVPFLPFLVLIMGSGGWSRAALAELLLWKHLMLSASYINKNCIHYLVLHF